MRQRAWTAGWVGVALCGAIAWGSAAVPEIEPNDAAPQAVGILAASTTILVDGASQYAGDIDWFSFEVAGGDVQAVRLATESPVEWQLVLYTEDLSYVGAGVNSVSRTLAPGLYRIRVQASELQTEDYLLLLSTALEREPNDGLAEATALGTLGDAELSAFASMDPAGDVDFFSFDVPEAFSVDVMPGTSKIVRIETPCPSGDTLLILYEQDRALGRPVPTARNDDAGPGTWSRLYITDPRPGRTTFRVHEYADNDLLRSYRVRVTTLTLAESEPNNTLEEAEALGSLDIGGRLERTHFISEGDTDAFSFSLATAACVKLETNGSSQGDSVITLCASTGAEIASDDNGGDDAWSRLVRNLEPGQYFVTVRAAEASESFDGTLVVTTTTCPVELAESEPNDGTATADAIVLPSDVTGEIAPGNFDLYRFEIQTPSALIAETYGDADGDTLMCLLDADGNSLICDDDGGDKLWSRIQYDVQPGTFYLRVELYAGTSVVPYHLLMRLDEESTHRALGPGAGS